MFQLGIIRDKLKRKFFEALYRRSASSILGTAPLERGKMPFTVLSMVQKRDVCAYLVALKSFVKHANPQRVVVICDPSITASDRETINSHVPHIEFRRADEFTHEDIPRGGTWERLYAISQYSTGDYVVQLDADTITNKSPTEVIRAIRENKGFVLGERPGQDLVSISETVKRAKIFAAAGEKHIQCIVEANMDASEVPQSSYYVRGCSGFTGFPKSDLMQERLIEFSRAMRALHSDRWSEWGTEQITSNYLVANMPGTRVLPFPLYGTPDVTDDSSFFVHYIGYLRFRNRKYEKDTHCVVRLLAENDVSQTGDAKHILVKSN